MSVRAKFKCIEVTDNGYEPGKGGVKLEVVINGSKENQEFFSYTPSGQIFMGVLNTEAFAQFEQGKEYYVDFTPVE